MKRKIEIFTMGAAAAKVECKSCPNSCESRDQVELTAEVLYNQLLALLGNEAEVFLYDYSKGEQDQILARQNEVYKENGVRRIVNKVLINALSVKIWPSVIIDGKIKSEGALLDTSRVQALLNV